MQENDEAPVIRAKVVVRDGRALFAELHVQAVKPLSALELHRTPWAQFLDVALAANVVEVSPAGSGWHAEPLSAEKGLKAVRRSKGPLFVGDDRRGRRPRHR